MKKYKLSTLDLQRFGADLRNSVVKSQDFFSILAVLVDQDVQTMFRTEGAEGGYRKIPTSEAWAGFKYSTLVDKKGNWRTRIGTDGTKRKYSPASKMLQASGQFRQSFHVMEVNQNRMRYGTQHVLSGKIGANPLRQVLFVTKADEDRFAKKYAQTIVKALQ